MNSRELCTYVGVIGGAIAGLFGGWDTALQTLVIFMAVDYITGLIVAGVFHTSPKTKTGTLESRAGWKGLCRKGVSLLDRLRVQRNHLHHRERRTHGSADSGCADQGGGCAEAEGGEGRKRVKRSVKITWWRKGGAKGLLILRCYDKIISKISHS